MAQDGSSGPTAANPLGLGLSFVDGAALVTLRDRRIAPGVELRALELELAEVEFPLDLEGGAEEFQRRSTHLVHLVLEVGLERVAEALAEALHREGRALRAPRLFVEAGRAVLEGRVGPDGPTVALDLVPGASDAGDLEVHIAEAHVFGPTRLPTIGLGRDLEVAARSALDQASSRGAESVVSRTPWVVSFDPIAALLWAVLPAHGWKVPAYDDQPIRRVAFTPDGAIQIVLGESRGQVDLPDAEPVSEKALLEARAREDLDRTVPAIEAQVASGAVDKAFTVLAGALEGASGARAFEHLVSVGLGLPERGAELSDLIDARLDEDPDDVFCLLARAVVAERDRDGTTAHAAYERAARRLRRLGRRRRAGLAYRAAAGRANSGSAERARLFEETIALRPDDVYALEGLVDILPGLGRASAAVRAARRLANLSGDPQVSLRAHLTAAELLFTQVDDKAGAKREWDRALKIAPEHPEALEGIARYHSAKGDARRAAGILERLAQQAERADDAVRASRLSLRLGDIWRPLDLDAALARYRRAADLAPRSARPLLSMAEAALEAGREAEAVELLDEAAPKLPGLSGNPDNREALLALRLLAGQLYAKSEDRGAEAVAQLEAALELDPQHAPASNALIDLYRARGDSAAAADLLGAQAEDALRSGAPDRAAELWRAHLEVAAEAGGPPPRLARKVLSALEAFPRNRALLDLAVQTTTETPKDHIRALEGRLALSDPPERRAELWHELGATRQATGDDAGAIRAFEEAVAASPAARDAANALVTLYRARADELRLVEALARAASLADDAHEQAQLQIERARLLHGHGEEGEAWAAMQRALETEADDLGILPFATSLALKAGDADAAREIVQRRLDLQADAPASERLSAYVDLANVEEVRGDRVALVAALQDAHRAADPHSDGGRRIAARLARELEARGDVRPLATLQLSRARVDTAPSAERAELALAAAKLFEQVGAGEEAQAAAEEVVALMGAGGVDAQALESALDVLAKIAARRDDPSLSARVMVLRAERATGPEADAMRLDAARTLTEAGRPDEAIASLEADEVRLERSAALQRALGELTSAQGRFEVAAAAFAKAAELVGDEEPSQVELHALAAAAWVEAGRPDRARPHDEAVLDRAPDGTIELTSAIERLEALARATEDTPLLTRLLERRAKSAAPDEAARLLLEKANLHFSTPGQDGEGLEALRRAHVIAPPDGEVADLVDARLAESLVRVGLYAEQAAVLSDWAERTKDGPARAERLFLAAQVYQSRLRDRSMALARAQAAVRADPGHEAARQMRIALLREDGRRDALAEALSEEAERADSAEVAAEHWLEAASLVAPRDDVTPEALARALHLARRAATAAPGVLAPVEAEVRYSRALGRPDEELSALGRLVERDLDVPHRVAVRLRRAHLLRGSLGDDLAAQAELEAALGVMLDASEEDIEAIEEVLPEVTREAYEGAADGDLVKGTLLAHLEVTEQLQEWAAHVRSLGALVERSRDAAERASLRVRAGEIQEWRLGDGAAAEREYLTALATDPNHHAARRALSLFYVAVDRFGELAESLGVEALVEVFEGFDEAEPPRRVANAAEALWPSLPEGSSERADVQLRLASIYADLDADAELVHVLEAVVQTGPRSHQDEALTRLRLLFDEMERHDLYVDVLRRQAERIETVSARALALAELGEALEWKLGDGQGAEQEYRTALAADTECGPARLRLAELLSSQDRYDEIAVDLGVEALRSTVDRLFGQGARDRERAFAAATALAAHLEEDARGALWLEVAQTLEDSPEDETARTREALEAATELPAARGEAYARLCRLLEQVGDRLALSEVLERRADVEEAPAAKVEWHMQRARVFAELGADGGLTQEAAAARRESALRAVLALDPAHERARKLVTEVLAERGAWVDLGVLLGDGVLRGIQADAEASADLSRARRVLEARAELAEGPERASRLVELVEYEGTDAEALYRGALDADSDSLAAQEGLRALLESQGRFRDVGELISPDALRTTLRGLKQLDDGAHLLPATLALVTVLSNQEGTEEERARLLVEAAALHQSEEDEEAAERALRESIDIVPAHPLAREELSDLLVRQGRFEALADVDPALVARAAATASEAGDQEVEIRALRVLAMRREGRAQADTLVLVAALEKARGHIQAAEEDLLRALGQDPEHALARSELEAILWDAGRYADALEHLGAQAVLRRCALVVDDAPEVIVDAVTAVAAALDPRARAEALEMAASAKRAEVDSAEEWPRRLAAAQEARDLWDELGDAQGASRARLLVVDVTRERDDVEALLEALEDAASHTTSAQAAAQLAIERATLLALLDRKDEARTIVEPVVVDGEVPEDHRRGAAHVLVEDLLEPWSDEAPPEGEALELRRAALELLTAERPAPGPDAARWWRELALARQALDAEPEEIAAALEAALQAGMHGEIAEAMRLELRGLYEETGDWRGAERHASVIAAANDDPDLWVQVSELRAWLDDRAGAEAALEAAISLSPGHAAANASLLRLAEQAGEQASVIQRIESWVAADANGDPEARLARLTQAFDLAVEARDSDKAGQLATRALEVAPAPSQAEVLRHALHGLERLGAIDAQVSLLTRALSEGGGPELRLKLADRLITLERADEARTVVEAGLHRDTPEGDPLVERLLEDARRLEADASVRRLLTVAERLEGGPAARRLRAEAAARAEAEGDGISAKQAWTSVLSEVAAGPRAVAAREGLVRLARAERDDRALFGALLASVDDAVSPKEKAARLVEAAALAEDALDLPQQAEALLRRAVRLVPGDAALEERLLAHLEGQGQWADVERELAARTRGTSGEARAELCEARAEIRERRLEDPLEGARMRVCAYEAAPSPERGRAAFVALGRAGALDEALALAETVSASLEQGAEPERERIDQARAELLESLGRIDEAAALLESRAEGLPAGSLLQQRLRQLLARHGRFEALADFLERAATDLAPGEGLLSRLAAARIRSERLADPRGARVALEGALAMVEGWMAASGAPIPDEIAPPPSGGGQLSERMIFEAPLLDLATQAAALGASQLRVSALRLYAQSMPEGLAQWRVLLLLAGAEREAGDLEAAEFTLRGVVEAIRDADEVEVEDRAEAERSLGALLLARGDAKGAVQALTRAQGLLHEGAAVSDGDRAAVLSTLSDAHRAAGDPVAAMRALVQADLLVPGRVEPAILEEAIEAAGPSEELAELMTRRAADELVPVRRASKLRAAADVWAFMGRDEMALAPRLDAYEADPSRRDEGRALETELAAAAQWPQVDRLLGLRLEVEDLTDDERQSVLLQRAALLETQLDRPEEALDLAAEAATRGPTADALRTMARLAARVGRTDLEQDALARLAALSEAPDARRSALLAKARLQNEARGTSALEQALELSFEHGFPITPLAERLGARYVAGGDYASLARLWVRVAGAREGAGSAVAFARAAAVRLEHLEDRRGAASALEAACRRAPEDLGLRRAALTLAESLGDSRRAETHARRGADVAAGQGRNLAAVSFVRAQARALAAAGHGEAELEAWRRCLELGASSAALDDLVNRAREGLPANEVEVILGQAEASAPTDAVKAGLLLARARLLDDPLGRNWEAEGLREDAAKLAPEVAPAFDAATTPEVAELSDAEYRTMRSMLDRSGRWSELADLEERQAARQPSRAARARALLEVAALHESSGNQDAASKAQDVLTRAVRLDGELVEAWAALAKIQVEQEAWPEAAESLERLVELGGAPWPPPEAQLLVARVAGARGDLETAKASLQEALARDPENLEALGRLARLSAAPEALAAWAAALDPVLDAEVLAEVAVARAEAAIEAEDIEGARAHAEAAFEAAPNTVSTRRVLRRALVLAAARPEQIVRAYLDEAEVSDEADRKSALLEALTLAEQEGLPDLAEVATRLEPYVADDATLRQRLIVVFRGRSEPQDMLRALELSGDLDRLSPLSEDERVAVCRALFEAERDEEGWRAILAGTPDGSREELEEAWRRGDLAQLAGRITRVFAPQASADLSMPQVRSRLRTSFSRSDAPLGPYGLAALTRCVVMWPRERALAERLAKSLEALECAEDAAVEYRALLAQAPGNVRWLDSALAVAGFEDARGLRAVRAWLRDGGGPDTKLPHLVAPLPSELHAALGLGTELAGALRVAASGIGRALPPIFDRPGPEGPMPARLQDAWARVSKALMTKLGVLVDPEGGATVRLESGPSASLAVGQAFLEEASPAQLDFRLARAAYALEAGYLLVERAPGPARQELLGQIADAVEAGEGPVAAHFPESERAALRGHVEVLRAATDLDVAYWRGQVLSAATRFGLLVAGDLAAAMAALDALEPRALGEARSTEAARIAAVERWGPLADLLTWLTQPSFVRVLAEAPVSEP